MELFVNDLGLNGEIPARIQPAVRMLLEASEYARRTTRDRWEFAVEIQQLRDLGLSPNDLRFLVRMQLVEHASEVTIAGQDGRQFQPTGDLTFTERSCFVLNSKVRAATDESGQAAAGNGKLLRSPTHASVDLDTTINSCRPNWGADSRILSLGDLLVKRFKWHAANQETVLAAFEEEGWPSHIDDPLPPHAEQDSKRRLSDTIKCLNRKQTNQLIHFRGDGTGEGIIWELTDPNG